MDRWSSRHEWTRRAEAWDAHLDRIALERMEAVHADRAAHVAVAARAAQEPIEALMHLLTDSLERRAGELGEWPLPKLYALLVRLTPVWAKAVEFEREARASVLRKSDR